MRILTGFAALAAAITFMAGTAHANGFMFKPYLGVEGSRVAVEYEDSPFAGFTYAQYYEESYQSYAPFIGVDLHKNFAIEVGYMDVLTEEKQIAGIGSTHVDFKGPYADLVLKLPMGRVSLLASAGIAQIKNTARIEEPSIGLDMKTSEKDTAWRFGGGLNVDITKNFSVRGMVRYMEADFKDSLDFVDSLTLYSVGILYRF